MLFALRNFPGSVNQYQLHNHITTFLKNVFNFTSWDLKKCSTTNYICSEFILYGTFLECALVWDDLMSRPYCMQPTCTHPVYFNRMKSFFLWYDSRVVCDVSDSIEISLRINRTYFTNLLQLNERPKRFQRKSSAGVVQNALNSSWQFSSHTRE